VNTFSFVEVIVHIASSYTLHIFAASSEAPFNDLSVAFCIRLDTRGMVVA
jgi:hypothetical protein